MTVGAVSQQPVTVTKITKVQSHSSPVSHTQGIPTSAPSPARRSLLHSLSEVILFSCLFVLYTTWYIYPVLFPFSLEFFFRKNWGGGPGIYINIEQFKNHTVSFPLFN